MGGFQLFLMCLLHQDVDTSYPEFSHWSSAGSMKWNHYFGPVCVLSSRLSVLFADPSNMIFLHNFNNISKEKLLVHWASLCPYSHSKYNAPFLPAFYIYTLLCRSLFVSFIRYFFSSFPFVFIHCQRKAFSWKLQNIRIAFFFPLISPVH